MKKIILPVLLAGTAVMIYIMMTTGAPLKTDATPKGILHLEFAYDKAHVDTILTAWGNSDRINAAIINTYWDFCFLLFYGLLLFTACRMLSEKFIAGSRKNNTGRFFAKAAILAAVLDMGENTGMLQTLYENGNPATWWVTTICAGVKWLLVLSVIVYILAALCMRKDRA